MNHDVTARVDIQFSCALPIKIIRVRDMEGTVESAVFLVTIYNVTPFWTPMVSLTFFRTKSSSANCNGVATNDIVAVIKQQKFMVRFQD